MVLKCVYFIKLCLEQQKCHVLYHEGGGIGTELQRDSRDDHKGFAKETGLAKWSKELASSAALKIGGEPTGKLLSGPRS